MATGQFAHGTVVTINDKTYTFSRLIEDDTWQLEEQGNRRIIEYKTKKLLSLYESGDLKFKLASYHSVSPFEKAREKDPRDAADYSPEQWETIKVRRSYVLSIGNLPYEGKLTHEAITQVWEKLGRPAGCPSARTVCRWRKDFFASGQDIASLIPRDVMKGNYKSRVPEELAHMAEDVIESVYLKRERKTQQDVLDNLIPLVNHENALRPKTLQLIRPTMRLIKRLIKKIPAFERHVARYGRDAAVKLFRHVKGHIHTDRPLQCVQIDHSPADCIVIDEINRMPLGRPYITVCIDVHTRRILGVYISFEPPSYFSVARCLRQALLPKENLLAEYPEIKGEWDAYGVFAKVVVDNGREFHSVSLENVGVLIGFAIEFAPRKRSWFKPHVERVLGTMIREATHGIPGTTFSDIFEKGEYDPVKTAIIPLSVLRKVIYKWIVDVYDKRKHRALETSPALMWKNSIQPEDIRLPANIEQLDAILGRSETRTLTHKGVELDKLFYNSPDMEVLRRRFGSTMEVSIRIDDSDLGEIIVLNPQDNRQTFRVPALRQDYAAGLTRYQHRKCRQRTLKQMKAETTDNHLAAKLEISQIIADEYLSGRRRTHKGVARYASGDISSVTQFAQGTPATASPEASTSEAPGAPGSFTGTSMASTTAPVQPLPQLSQDSTPTETSAPALKYPPLVRPRP